jgi:hypothetical protein
VRGDYLVGGRELGRRKTERICRLRSCSPFGQDFKWYVEAEGKGPDHPPHPAHAPANKYMLWGRGIFFFTGQICCDTTLPDIAHAEEAAFVSFGLACGGDLPAERGKVKSIGGDRSGSQHGERP